MTTATNGEGPSDDPINDEGSHEEAPEAAQDDKKNDEQEEANGETKPTGAVTRKNPRNKYKNKGVPQFKPTSFKERNRRQLFKRNVMRTTTSYATPITSECIFFKGQYFQIGDIVSMVDMDDGLPYFAQIRGFLTDQFCEKSAVVTWLLPTQGADPHKFDLRNFVLGPEEDIPRKLECMQFICNATIDYFKPSTPYPVLKSQVDTNRGYVWARIGPKIVSKEELEKCKWDVESAI